MFDEMQFLLSYRKQRCEGEMERKNRNAWYLSGVVIICFMIGICLGILGNPDTAETEAYRVAIGEGGTDRYISFQLKNAGNGVCKMIGMKKGDFVVYGMLNQKRGYFEGSISWTGRECYLYDCAGGESRLLDEKLHSFQMGDYYIRCEYKEQLSRMDLLIIYCPEE